MSIPIPDPGPGDARMRIIQRVDCEPGGDWIVKPKARTS